MTDSFRRPRLAGLAAALALASTLVLALGAAAPAAAILLDEAEIFIEINATDGDAGIQIFLDGEGWEAMQVLDPDGNVILDVDGLGGVGEQGITELFLESAEPSFDEQPLDEFLGLFPEGAYRFRGRTTDGVPLRRRAILTHDLPAAPILVSPADGDEVEPEDVVVRWLPVPDPPGSRIVGYQVIVETEEPVLRVFQVDLGPGATEVEVPDEFMRPGREYKYEVIAIERSNNKTISEAEFETTGGDDDDDEEEDDEEEEGE